MKRRVAFPLLGGAVWTGGHSYMRNLFRVLASSQSEHVAPVMMVPPDTADDAMSGFGDIAGLEITRLPAHLWKQRSSRARAVILGRDKPLERWLQAQRIDLVFEATDFIGWRNNIPVLTWIPDFQHRHLPKMFERKRLWGRELLYQLQARSGRTIMLSSEATRVECEHFYPGSKGHTVVVHFSVPAGISAKDADLIARYQLPKDFLYLPNQFWQHKNHGLVLDALSLLRDERKPISVIASGNPADVRDPSYYPRLQEKVRKLNLANEWRVLGMIPYPDVLGLMRLSIAVINPSFVEGWSTTVEEAKALQVPLALSDIAVHREQALQDAVFFDPNSPRAAADALYAAWTRFASMPRGEHRSPDLSASRRLNEFGRDFVDAVELAIGRHRLG